MFANLFGHQYLEPKDDLKLNLFKEIGVSIAKDKPFDLHTPVVYVPIFTLIEFIAYLGWIKVAETLLNPWGDDDEDFQINYLIDRNFQVNLNFETLNSSLCVTYLNLTKQINVEMFIKPIQPWWLSG